MGGGISDEAISVHRSWLGRQRDCEPSSVASPRLHLELIRDSGGRKHLISSLHALITELRPLQFQQAGTFGKAAAVAKCAAMGRSRGASCGGSGGC